jgi:hypothetical protein
VAEHADLTMTQRYTHLSSTAWTRRFGCWTGRFPTVTFLREKASSLEALSGAPPPSPPITDRPAGRTPSCLMSRGLRHTVHDELHAAVYEPQAYRHLLKILTVRKAGYRLAI